MEKNEKKRTSGGMNWFSLFPRSFTYIGMMLECCCTASQLELYQLPMYKSKQEAV